MAERRSRKRRSNERPRFQSGLSILPSLFTVGNIFCGFFAAISTLRGNFDGAAIAIGIGSVLDGLDGRIARLTGTSSDFGMELDSLADVITFGIAPAMLAFEWGFGALVRDTVAQDVIQFGLMATFAFLMCGALRLARFNVQAKKPQETSEKRFFVGLPIPAAACTIAAFVHFFKQPILMPGSALLWCFLVLMAALLMISTVRYYSFKDLDMKRVNPRVVLLVFAMMIWLTISYSEVVLLSLAAGYVTSGPITKLVQLVRRLLPGTASSSEPGHGNIRS
jgi:CDP-diacylglycerol--serine O-phosphatidyltransferase